MDTSRVSKTTKLLLLDSLLQERWVVSSEPRGRARDRSSCRTRSTGRASLLSELSTSLRGMATSREPSCATSRRRLVIAASSLGPPATTPPSSPTTLTPRRLSPLPTVPWLDLLLEVEGSTSPSSRPAEPSTSTNISTLSTPCSQHSPPSSSSTSPWSPPCPPQLQRLIRESKTEKTKRDQR